MLEHRLASPPPSPAGRPRRTLAVSLIAVALMLALSAAGYSAFARAARVQRDTAASTRAIERTRSLAERAGLQAARLGMGDAAAAPALRATAAALRRAGRHLRPGGLRATIAQLAIRTSRIADLPRGDARVGPAAAHVVEFVDATVPGAFDAAIAAEQERSERLGAVLLALAAASAATLAVLILAAALGVIRPLLRESARLRALVAEFSRAATTDPLTGTLNERGFTDRGTLELHKARRHNRPLALLMIDPDQLEPITRSHGSTVGDSVLRALTATLADGTRASDLVGRVGDEFAVLLPETDLAGAQLLAERLRRRIGELLVPIDRDAVSCTVSIGVAAAEKDAALLWPTLKRAGEALYEAQMRGRNRVFVAA